ncbi:MAG TPA: hypothetical protein VL172_21370, partial [Kofleriaceae bacterium]|nr:hypothetical protein [Kofleriaceae bacterium]
VNLRATYGSPWSLQRRSFLWDPATPGAVIEMPFTWEGTGAMQLPVNGGADGVAVTDDLIFVPVAFEHGTGDAGTQVTVYDRATMLPVGTMAVGLRPSAIVIR